MGNSSSQNIDPCLLFISDTRITNDMDNNDFWELLFSSLNDQGRINKEFPSFCSELLKNNVITRNFSKLIIQVIKRIKHCSKQNIIREELEETYSHITTNSIILLRTISHYFILQCDPTTLQFHFSSKTEDDNHQTILLAGPLMDCISNFIIHGDFSTDEQKNLLYEVLLLFIVLLSTQLHSTVGESYPHLFKDNLYHRTIFPYQEFIQSLLNIFINKDLRNYRKTKSLISTLASYSMVAYGMMFLDNEIDNNNTKNQLNNISDHSLLLLLCLISDSHQNPFSNTLSKCYDSTYLLQSSTKSMYTFEISFNDLYDTISSLLISHGNITPILLLSHLLQFNSLFLSYVLSRSDLELIVVPMLKIVYNALDSLSSYTIDHILLVCVILLILSRDKAFISHSQHQKILNVPWHKEQTLVDISLTDLIFTIILKALHTNLTKYKDKILQINGMAILVNMSSSFEKMNSHTVHRLLALLDVLSKRYFKCKEQGKKDTNTQNVNIYAKFLQMIFEILNSCLYYGIVKNPHFIYGLLYSKDSFRKFAADNNFSQFVVNIQIAIDFFDEALSQINFEVSDYSSESVLNIINTRTLDWKNIYFKYIVNEQYYNLPEYIKTSEFYIPITWITILSNISYWPHPMKLKLFVFLHPFQLSKQLRLQYISINNYNNNKEQKQEEKTKEINIKYTKKHNQSPILEI